MNEDNLKNIINFKDYPINETNWLKKIQNQFDETGIVSLENFVLPESMDNIKKELIIGKAVLRYWPLNKIRKL